MTRRPTTRRNQRSWIAALTLPLVCLAACSSPSEPAKSPSTSTKTASTTAKATPKLPPPKAESLTGTAAAPAGIVAAGGGNILSHNGGQMVAAGAGNMVAAGAGNFVVLAIDEKPLAGAPVWLVPADDKAEVPSRAPDATTDEKGAFILAVNGKSKTGAYAVVVGGQNAAGKSAPFSTVVEADPKGKSTQVGAATTMVASTLRKRGAGAFSAFDLKAFGSLVELLANNLSLADLPDFSDPDAVAAKADELGKRLDAFGKALGQWGDAVEKDPTSILNGNLPGLPGLTGLKAR